METTASSSGGGKPSASAWTKRRRGEAGQSPRKKEGEGKNKVATAANDATWDDEEEALGALIYKFSRTARARADAEEKKRRRSSAAPLGDELQPWTKKRRRKAGKEGASPLTAAVGAEISPDRDETPTKRQINEENNWAKRYDQLREYKEEHGHCNVPRRYAENPQLGAWVHKQRPLHKNGKLSGDRVRRLEGIEFQWTVVEIPRTSWDERFEELSAYKARHGNCNVPQRYAKNPPLGKWVDKQRQNVKKGKLWEERRERLEEIGFRWAVIT